MLKVLVFRAPAALQLQTLCYCLYREVLFNQVLAGFEPCTFGTGARRLSHLSSSSYLKLADWSLCCPRPEMPPSPTVSQNPKSNSTKLGQLWPMALTTWSSAFDLLRYKVLRNFWPLRAFIKSSCVKSHRTLFKSRLTKFLGKKKKVKGYLKVKGIFVFHSSLCISWYSASPYSTAFIRRAW